MSAHPHPHPGRPRSWGEPRPSWLTRLWARLTNRRDARHAGLPELPLALRRCALAEAYLGAERDGDHRRAGAAAVSAMDRAAAIEEWWQADAWAHRALWHFEQAGMTLQASMPGLMNYAYNDGAYSLASMRRALAAQNTSMLLGLLDQSGSATDNGQSGTGLLNSLFGF